MQQFNASPGAVGFQFSAQDVSPLKMVNGCAWIGQPGDLIKGAVAGFRDYDAVLQMFSEMKGYQIVPPGWRFENGILLTDASRQFGWALVRPVMEKDFHFALMQTFKITTRPLPLPVNFYMGLQYALLPSQLKPSLTFAFPLGNAAV